MPFFWIAFLVFLSLYEIVLSNNNSRSRISGGDNIRNRSSFSETNISNNFGYNRSKTIKNGNKRASLINLKTVGQIFSTTRSNNLMEFIQRHKYSNKSRDMKSRLQNVCVFHHNWRTASLFELNALSFRGNGSLKYIVNDNSQLKRNCKSGLTSTPYNVELVSVQGNNVNYNFQYADELKGVLFSKPVKRIVTGDEECDCKFSDCGIFPNMKAVVARQYFSEKLMPQWEFGGSFKSRPNSIAFIPLGPRSDFGLIHQSLKAADYYPANRTWLFNLIISPTSESRKRLVKVINSTSFSKSLKSPVPYFMNVASHWHGKFGAAAPDTINSTTYKQILSNSFFTLCPNGNNPESFRIYEAVEAGSIPILALDNEYTSHACKNAFLPFIKYGAPFVFIKDWKLLPKTLAMFIKYPEKVTSLQRRLKPWYMQFMANVSKQLENTLNYGRRLPKPAPKAVASKG